MQANILLVLWPWAPIGTTNRLTTFCALKTLAQSPMLNNLEQTRFLANVAHHDLLEMMGLNELQAAWWQLFSSEDANK